MNLLIALEQDEILNKFDDVKGTNPGVGGTTYTAIRLAYALYEEVNIESYNLNIFLGISSSKIEKIYGIPTINIYKKNNKFWDCVLITGGILNDIDLGKVKLESKRFIAWIRHPFDWDKIKKAEKLNAEIVSVGKNQFLSNFLIKGNHHHIDNLFCADRVRSAAFNEKSNIKKILNLKNKCKKNHFTIGFMSALIPSKGFHLLAKQWIEIVKYCNSKNLEIRLEVIGGSNLYGFEQDHAQLPCSKSYGNLIQKLLGSQIGKTVFFHGNLGKERFFIMSKCDMALVNPSGEGEAFPATILEWYSLGIPVISSLSFGCADAMRFNTKLAIQKPDNIKNKILEFICLDKKLKEKMCVKCYSIASSFSSNQKFIVYQWILLLLSEEKSLKLNEYLGMNIILNNLKIFMKLKLKKILRKFLFFQKIFEIHFARF